VSVCSKGDGLDFEASQIFTLIAVIRLGFSNLRLRAADTDDIRSPKGRLTLTPLARGQPYRELQPLKTIAGAVDHKLAGDLCVCVCVCVAILDQQCTFSNSLEFQLIRLTSDSLALRCRERPHVVP
jgi:hypothetical protein